MRNIKYIGTKAREDAFFDKTQIIWTPGKIDTVLDDAVAAQMLTFREFEDAGDAMAAVGSLGVGPDGLTLGGQALTAWQAAQVLTGSQAGKMLRGGRAGAIGDSIPAIGQASWFHQLCLKSDGRIKRAKNAGVAGNTTTQMVARIVADLPKSLKLDVIFVTGGTNDVAAAVTLATTLQNLTGMVLYAQSIGAQAVLVKPPPKNTQTSFVTEIRAAYDSLGAQLGVIVLDPWAAYVAVTGGLVDGVSSDGIHPNIATADAGAAAAWAQLSPFVSPGWSGLHAMTGMPGAIVTADDFFADTDANGTPNGFSGYAIGTVVVTKTTAAGSVGNKFRMTTAGVDSGGVAAAGERVEERSITGLTLAEGTRFAVSAKVTLSGYASGVRCHVRANMTGASALGLEPTYFSGDLNEAVVWAESTVPAGGATSVSLTLRLVTTGTSTPSVGYLEVQQMQVWDLTAMGIA